MTIQQPNLNQIDAGTNTGPVQGFNTINSPFINKFQDPGYINTPNFNFGPIPFQGQSYNIGAGVPIQPNVVGVPFNVGGVTPSQGQPFGQGITTNTVGNPGFNFGGMIPFQGQSFGQAIPTNVVGNPGFNFGDMIPFQGQPFGQGIPTNVVGNPGFNFGGMIPFQGQPFVQGISTNVVGNPGFNFGGMIPFQGQPSAQGIPTNVVGGPGFNFGGMIPFQGPFNNTDPTRFIINKFSVGALKYIPQSTGDLGLFGPIDDQQLTEFFDTKSNPEKLNILYSAIIEGNNKFVDVVIGHKKAIFANALLIEIGQTALGVSFDNDIPREIRVTIKDSVANLAYRAGIDISVPSKPKK